MIYGLIKINLRIMKNIAFTLLFALLFMLNISLAQWVNVSNGLGNKQVYSLVNTGSVLFAGTFNYGLYLSSDYGNNWTTAGTGLYNRIVFSLTNFGGYLYAGTDLGAWRTSNSGAYWSVTSINNNTVYSLAANQSRVFAGLHLSGLFYSSGGTGWFISSLGVTDIKTITLNGNFILAGAGNNAGVHVSNNNGNNWTASSLNNKSIYALALNGSKAYAGTGSGIYRSVDSGYTWTQTPVNNELVQSLAVIGENVFAGSETNGVYFSGNNGLNWSQINDGLGSIGIYSLYIFNNYIFAGASVNGVYRRPLSELTGISAVETPRGFSLSQNYPNPFNSSSKINFRIAKQGNIKIAVYDIAGKEIMIIVNQTFQPGLYETYFDGSQLTSGVYFYKLITEGFTETKKMLIVK